MQSNFNFVTCKVIGLKTVAYSVLYQIIGVCFLAAPFFFVCFQKILLEQLFNDRIFLYISISTCEISIHETFYVFFQIYQHYLSVRTATIFCFWTPTCSHWKLKTDPHYARQVNSKIFCIRKITLSTVSRTIASMCGYSHDGSMKVFHDSVTQREHTWGIGCQHPHLPSWLGSPRGRALPNHSLIIRMSNIMFVYWIKFHVVIEMVGRSRNETLGNKSVVQVDTI